MPTKGRLLTIEDEDTGKRFTATSRTPVTREQLDGAITSFQAGKSTPGFQVFDVTPQQSIGERAGRAVGRGSRAIKRGIAGGLESRFLPFSETSRTIAKTVGENLPLPESLADVGADVGLAASTFATGGAGVIPTLVRTAAPGLASFLGGLIEGRPTSEAAGQAGITTAAAGVPEIARIGRGFVRRAGGKKFLLSDDTSNISRGLQQLLPEGSPRLPSAPNEFASFVTKSGKNSLRNQAQQRFNSQLREVARLVGNKEVNVPSLSDEVLTVSEAIRRVTGDLSKIPKELLSEKAKQIGIKRGAVLRELAEELTQKAPRKTGITRPGGGEFTIGGETDPNNLLALQIYQNANKEFKVASDIRRLFLGKEAFDTKTGAINVRSLQARFNQLSKSDSPLFRPSEEVTTMLDNVLSRGEGPLGQRVDQPLLEVLRGVFTRSSPLPGASLTPTPQIPSFVGTTQRTFGAPRTRAVSPIVAGTLGQKLRNSPFEVQ